MTHWLLVSVFAVTCSLVVAADEKAAADPELGEAVAIAVDPNDVDQKRLRKKLGARVQWDPKTGILTLTYDFTGRNQVNQLKDWQVPNGAAPKPVNGQGFRIAPAESLVHRGIFLSGSCTVAFAIRNIEDRGSVVSAGEAIAVSQKPWGGHRQFQLCDKDVKFGTRETQKFLLTLVVHSERCELAVNGAAEVAVKQAPGKSFQFTLHGGDNGADFGTVTISGRPEKRWVEGLMQK